MTIHDPNISISRLVGANRKYIEEHVPHLASLLVEDLEVLFEKSEILVVGHRLETLISSLGQLRPDQHIIDLVRIADRVETPASYEGISW